ncbi:uncharacterized protein CBL_01373 [Carabus blaptoides fortunei]
MKVVALVSGGKDSCYNMMQCVAAGHEIVALGNLEPYNKDELDSYMYQSVAHEGVALMGQAMDLPLYRVPTIGKAHQIGKDYIPTNSDEVEDLYSLLQKIQADMQIEGVAVGAILSDYQRVRVENVCTRLGLVSLAYLWQRDQSELLQEMIDSKVSAILVKVATLGLDPTKHLGKTIKQLQPHLLNMKEKYGLNVCGEGGEYETFTLDCPLYKNSIVIDDSELIIHSDNAIAPVGYLRLNKLHLVQKTCPELLMERLSNVCMKDADGYITDPGEEATENQDCENDIEDENDCCTIKTECDSEVALVEHPAVSAITNTGWMWCGGLAGYGESVEECMESALNKLESCLNSANLTVQDICAINMFVRDMSQYPILNKIYCRVLSHINPPTRVCVEAPLPENCHVLMEALAWKAKPVSGEGNVDKHTMHVQGISHWAPANIGPYSQAIRVDDIICVAGQIGLVPGNMQLVKGGIRQQCQLALRHIGRIVKAMDHTSQFQNVVQGVCYVTKSKYIEHARREWEERTNNAIVDYVVISELPRSALIEWHVWAHRHNNQFEYEETGKCVDHYSISIRRRWNYENNVAAIVCHAAFTEPDAADLTADLFQQVLEYTLVKLNQDYDTSASVSYLRLFYPVHQANTDMMYTVLNDMRSQFNIVYTLVPVCSLQHSSVLLSVCGIRNE